MDKNQNGLATDGETEYKNLIMKRSVVRALGFIFFGAALLLLLFKIYLRNNNRNEDAETVQWIALGLLLASLICRFINKLFPKWFDNKLTREEIENRVHNDKSSEH